MSNKWYARAVSDYNQFKDNWTTIFGEKSTQQSAPEDDINWAANGVDVTFYEENMLQKGEESTTK